MRKNYFLRFNTQQYEMHLTPFGQQVFKNLIKGWRTGHNNNRNDQLRPPQPRPGRMDNELMSFDESLNFYETVCDPLSFENENDGTEVNVSLPGLSNDVVDGGDRPPSPCVSRSPQALLPRIVTSALTTFVLDSSVPTTDSVIVATDDHTRPHSHKPNLPSRDDLITTYPNNNLIEECWNDLDDVPTCCDKKLDKTKNIPEFSNKHDKRNVGWNDMFDTELLSDIEELTNDVPTMSAENSHVDNKHISCLKSVDETQPNADPQNESEIINQLNYSLNDKKIKRKTQTKVTDTIPKKVKKNHKAVVDQMKKSNRKQKYTKTVTKWLNEVDSGNLVEDIKENKQCAEQAASEDKLTKTKDGNGKYKETVTKKIVQTRLANKGGVMKFGKPNVVSVGEIGQRSEAKDIDEVKLTCKETGKQKKSKPKFVAPIKSQILVEDITYDVHTVNDDNVQQYNLDPVIDQEIVVMLLYNNGFCQLDDRHTENSGAPEGLMLLVDDTFYYFKDPGGNIRELLARLLKSNTIVCYDGKVILIYLLAQCDLEFDTKISIIDVKIAGSLLDADSPPDSFSGVMKLAWSGSPPPPPPPPPRGLQGAAGHAVLLRDCARALRPVLLDNALWQLFTEIEMPLLPILADMEHHGVHVDVESLNSMGEILLRRMKRVEQACYAAAGRAFRINSAPQVRALLYGELRLHTGRSARPRDTLARRDKSTSEAVLRSLAPAHPLPGLIVQYRQLHKAHATFVVGIASRVKDGVVKPTWEQLAAATGRIGCSNPNLQAIPKGPLISDNVLPGCSGFDADVTEHERGAGAALRAVFVSGAGGVLLAADFRHVECRVFAHIAGDHSLAEALRAPDLFRNLASQWLQRPAEAVTAEERARTKCLVYASLYGAGARTLMDILGVDYPRALAVSAEFSRRFPSLRKFGEALAAACAARGGRLAAPSGRTRRLPLAPGAGASPRAVRQALNFLVQGCAADACKLGMRAAAAALRGRGLRARLVLQLHDELVWDVPRGAAPAAAAVIKQAMEECGRSIGLPRLPVALSAGRSWGRLQPYTAGAELP